VFLGANGELRHGNLADAPLNFKLGSDGFFGLNSAISNEGFSVHTAKSELEERLSLIGSQIVVTGGNERTCKIKFNGNYLYSTADGLLTGC
jgi:hypothetical protein